MPAPLPAALVEVLREMRDAGVSIGGLVEATGLSNVTVIKYTSGMSKLLCECGRPGNHRGNCAVRRRTSLSGVDRSIGERTRKWTDEADALVRRMWPLGASEEMLQPVLTAMLGYQPTLYAILVRAGHLGVTRADKAHKRTDAIAAARRAYWERWRRGEVTNNRRCPPPRDAVTGSHGEQIGPDDGDCVQGAQRGVRQAGG